MNRGADDWTPQFEQPAGLFKWGIDGSTGELTVWEVGGPGDGLPVHSEVLTEAWGRDDHYRPGDLLGWLLVSPEDIKVSVYFESAAEVPPPLRAWANTVFPDHTVRLVEKGRPSLDESAESSG